MITPAYSPTATERVLPRMALDFTTGVLDPRVTVARALDTATRVNSSGYVEVVNANLPRFDYNPTTLAAKGLLIEEARTNLLLRSEEFNDAYWVKSGVTVSANATTSPDGTVDADKIIINNGVASGSSTFINRDITKAASATTYTVSVFAKADGFNSMRLRCRQTSNFANEAFCIFDLAAGTAGTATANGTFTSASATITLYANGFYRCVLTFTSGTETDLSFRVLPESGTGDGIKGIFAWGAQVEAGAFATSYIPTTTTSLTRNADVVSMTGTNFSDWYNASEGTFVTGYRVNNLVTPSVKPVFAAYDGTFNSNRVYLNAGVSGQTNLLVNSGGSAQASILGAFVTANTLVKTASKYKVNDFALATNGITPATDTSGLVPVGSDRLDIGVYQPASVYLNGHMAFINYYPLGLTTNEVRAFSK